MLGLHIIIAPKEMDITFLPKNRNKPRQQTFSQMALTRNVMWLHWKNEARLLFDKQVFKRNW